MIGVKGAKISALKESTLLFHLSLSGVTAVDAKLGEEIVKQTLPNDTKLTACSIEECIRQHAGDVIILLDSFDESVFALLKAAPENCGSLYDAIAFKRFRGCIFVVTLRSWKGNTFYEELFNEYTEIGVNGIVSDNFDTFVRRYCNATNANNVEQILKTNLINLRPMFRNPLFVIMICELVVNNVRIDNYFLTLTNLLQKLCEYLFKSYKAKAPAAMMDNIHETGVDKYLVGIGEIASNNNFTYIDAANEKLSSEQNELLQVGLSIGLISTSQRYDGRHGRLYFFHGLLRDFCVAKYYHHMLKVHNTHEERIGLLNSIFIKSFPWQVHINDNSDNHDTCNNSFLNYFSIFMCAFNPSIFEGLDTITHIGSGPLVAFEKKYFYRRISFLSQCMYESKCLDLNTPLNTPEFLKNRCIVLDMSIINSHAATEYILSAVSKDECLVPQEFVVLGDTFMSKSQASTSERCGSSPINDDRTTLFQIGLEREVLSDLLSKCRLLTTLKLMNLKMTCHTEKLDNIKNLSQLESIVILNVGSVASAKYLLNFVSCYLEHVQELYLINVRVSLYVEQSSDLRFQDLFFLLCDVADRARCVILPSINGINELVVSPERIDSMSLLNLRELYLGQRVEYVNYQQLLAKLVYCPKLERITLKACYIDFTIDTKCKVIGQIRRSIAKLILQIEMCKNEILFANVMFISSKFYPKIEELIVLIQLSQVKFAEFHPRITITAKCQTILRDCTCTVVGSEKSPIKDKLGLVAFCECTLNKSKSCNISDFIQYFQQFFIHSGDGWYVRIHDERICGDQIRPIYTPHVYIYNCMRAVDIHDVIASVEDWIPISSLTALYFFTNHDMSLDDAFTFLLKPEIMRYSHLNEMRFGESVKYIDCEQFLTKLVSCPNLAKIGFDNCSIDFDVDTSLWKHPGSTGSSGRKLLLQILRCKNTILFANLIFILSTLFPAISNCLLELHHSNVKFTKFHSKTVIGPIQGYLNNCNCIVIESDVSPFEKGIQSIKLSECTLTQSSIILGVLKCCESLQLLIKSNIHMQLRYEEQSKGDKSDLVFSPIIICADGTAIDIHDVTSFLQKIPISSIKTLAFNTVLDLPLNDDKLAAVKACAMDVNTVVFKGCKNTLDMFQHLMVMCTCFTSLSQFVVLECNLSFAHTQVERRTGSKGLLLDKWMREKKLNKLIHIEECKPVTMSDMLMLIELLSPYVKLCSIFQET